MEGALASAVVAVVCAALIGIQSAVVTALRTSPGAVTTAITLGAGMLGVWAVVVLREE